MPTTIMAMAEEKNKKKMGASTNNICTTNSP